MKIVTLFTFLFFSLSNSWAFILLDKEYKLAKPDNVIVNIANGGCLANGISDDDLKDYLNETVKDYWNTVSESRLFLKVGGVIAKGLGGDPDPGEIIVGCANIGAGLAGVANVNSSRDGCRIRMSATSFVGGNFLRESFMGTLIHEMGHCVGLHHSDDLASVMTYRAQSFNQPTKLARDDKDAVVYLYPIESKATILGGCNAIAGDDRSFKNDGQWPLDVFFFLTILLSPLLISRAFRFS